MAEKQANATEKQTLRVHPPSLGTLLLTRLRVHGKLGCGGGAVDEGAGVTECEGKRPVLVQIFRLNLLRTLY